jgi:hypothetical protein
VRGSLTEVVAWCDRREHRGPAGREALHRILHELGAVEAREVVLRVGHVLPRLFRQPIRGRRDHLVAQVVVRIDARHIGGRHRTHGARRGVRCAARAGRIAERVGARRPAALSDERLEELADLRVPVRRLLLRPLVLQELHHQRQHRREIVRLPVLLGGTVGVQRSAGSTGVRSWGIAAIRAHTVRIERRAAGRCGARRWRGRWRPGWTAGLGARCARRAVVPDVVRHDRRLGSVARRPCLGGRRGDGLTVRHCLRNLGGTAVRSCSARWVQERLQRAPHVTAVRGRQAAQLGRDIRLDDSIREPAGIAAAHREAARVGVLLIRQSLQRRVVDLAARIAFGRRVAHPGRALRQRAGARRGVRGRVALERVARRVARLGVVVRPVLCARIRRPGQRWCRSILRLLPWNAACSGLWPAHVRRDRREARHTTTVAKRVERRAASRGAGCAGRGERAGRVADRRLRVPSVL